MSFSLLPPGRDTCGPTGKAPSLSQALPPEQGLLQLPFLLTDTRLHFSVFHLTFSQYLAITNDNAVMNDVVAVCVCVVKSVSSEHIPRNGIMVQK